VRLLREGRAPPEIAKSLGVTLHIAKSLIYSAEPILDPSLRIDALPEEIVRHRDLGHLRWERIAARSGVTVHVAKDLYREGGGDPHTSWTGRGRPPAGGGGGEKRQAASLWLSECLSDGPRPVAQLKEGAEEAGFSWGAIRRAAAQLGIERRREGFGGRWLWSLQRESDGAQRTPAAAVVNVRTGGLDRGVALDAMLVCDNCGTEVAFVDGATVTVQFHTGNGVRTASLCMRCAGFLPGR
jgi:hypothetical protein